MQVLRISKGLFSGRNLVTGLAGAIIILQACVLSSCAGTPSPQDAGSQAGRSAGSATIELAEAWSNAEVRVERTVAHDVGANRAMAGFECVWTDGQDAGPVYPQQFVLSDSGEEVPMEFTWDSGGHIQEGVYDVYVEIDGRAGAGWIRDLSLTGDKRIEVRIDLNACQFDLSLDTYRDVTVYPSGTYEDYNSRNMLDAIPEDAAITWYNSENLGQWAVAPSGTFDLKVIYADDTTEWFEDYRLPANARVAEL